MRSHPPGLGKFVYYILLIQKRLQNAVSGSLMLLDPKESFVSGVENSCLCPLPSHVKKIVYGPG